MAFFRHMGKKRTEYTMSICVHSGDHVTHGTSGKALKNGQPVSVQCKRGNKVYSTRMAVIEHSSVHWDEVLTFPITVYGKEESSKMTWDKKIYQFMIRTDGKSDTRLSTRIDLAEYIHTTSTHPITKFFALSEGDDSSSSSSSTSTPQKRTDSSQHMSSPSTSTSTSSIPMSPNTASTSSTPVLKLTIRATLASKAHSSPAMSSPSPTTSIPSLTTQASSPQLQTHSMNTFTTCDEESGTEHSHSSMNIPISPKHDEMISPKKNGNEIPIPSTPITTSTSTSTTISTSAPPKTTTSSSTLTLPSSKPHQLHHPRNSNEIIDGRETRSVSEAFDRVMIKPTSSTDAATATLTIKPTSDITRHDIESFEALVLSDQKERLSVPKNNMTRNRDPSMDFSSILGDEARMNRFSMALDDHIRQPRSHHSPQSHSPSSPSITISTDAAPSTTSSSHASSALSSPTLSLSASSSSSSHLDSHDDIRSISISTSHTPLSSTASTPANHDHAATARDTATARRSVLIPGSSGTLPLIKRGKDKRRGFSRFIGPNGTTHDFLEAEEDNRTRGDTKFQIHHTM